MPVNIKTTAGYLYLDSWVLASVIQLSTLSFCRRFLDKGNDPCGRQFDQMTQAARSVTANIAEGASRHQTSRETEMKLTDVARASLNELAGDYLFFLMASGHTAWEPRHPAALDLRAVRLDAPRYGESLLHDATAHILLQKQRFDRWTESPDALTAANAMLILCGRLINILRRQMERLLNDFRAEGGFSENLTQERLAAIQRQNALNGSPACPVCGKPMRRRMARKGINSGHEFWSCTDYPNCRGTRSIESGPQSGFQSSQSIQSNKSNETRGSNETSETPQSKEAPPAMPGGPQPL